MAVTPPHLSPRVRYARFVSARNHLDVWRGTDPVHHFHVSKHPIMRSFEPGDDWRWCYVDEREV